MELTIGLAFLGGMVSFFSPCVLAIMPVYIGYIGGYSFSDQEKNDKARFRPIVFFHGLIFVLGFSIVFLAMGAVFSALGGYLALYRVWMLRATAIIIILFGLHMTGIFRIKYLDYEIRITASYNQLNNLAATFVLGIVFAAGWSPCIGPVLGSILALSLNSGSVYWGTFFLFFYSLGMAIPFLVACLTIETISTYIRKYSQMTLILEKIMGSILVIVGLLLLTGFYDLLLQPFSISRLGSPW